MITENIYWFIVLLTLVYVVFKNRRNLLKILIILCFYFGLASFQGKAIENPYKIVLVILSLYFLVKSNGLSGMSKKEGTLIFVFALFSVSFLYSSFINGDYFNLTFSQYGKLVTPICFYFVFNRILLKNTGNFIRLKDLFISLLTIQILLSFMKIFAYGLSESPVGSIAYKGGGPATLLPVLGFIIIWLDNKGTLKRNDWVYIILLTFIAFASLKRAIWFIMPVYILLFMYYVPKKVPGKKLLYVLPLAPLLFYLGIRLSPSLNKEGKIGGSFDLNFVMDYAQAYSFGKTTQESQIQVAQGRGGATLLLWQKLANSQALTFEDFWGNGLSEVYTTDYEQFNEEKYGVNSKGAVTGVFQSYISSGYVGIVVTILLIIAILRLIKEHRIRVAIGFLMFWDYLFYSGIILRTQVLLILLFFIIIYSNLLFERNMKNKYIILNSNDQKRNLQL
jgi:hypothetical protein